MTTTTEDLTYSPQSVSPPGETLQETIDALGMKQAELARRTGRPTKSINEIIKGKAAITPQTALQLAIVTGVPAEFWNARETRYREYLAAQKEREALASETSFLKGFPLTEMRKMGWIPETFDKVECLHNILKFLGIASPAQFNACQAQFRRSPALAHDAKATHAWLRKGVIEAQKVSCGPYHPEAFRAVLAYLRQSLMLPLIELIPLIKEKCAAAGVAVILVRELPKTGGSGATQWAGSRPIVQLSCRYKTTDHLLFTFFHESEHILRHAHGVFIEGGGAGGDAQNEEDEADRGACDRLIPPSGYAAFCKLSRFSKAKVEEFAAMVGVPAGIVVGRLQHDGLVQRKDMNGLKDVVSEEVQRLWV